MDPDAVDDLRSGASESPSDDTASEANAPSEPQAGVGAGRVPHGSSEDPHLLDFSANTNPLRPDGVRQVYDATLSVAESYPTADYDEFRAAAAEYVGCDAADVIPTAGGLAAIRLTIATTVQSGDEVLVPTPSFGEYAREVRLQGGTPRFVPHDEVLDADPAEFALVVVCTPNNPTGDASDPDRLWAFADRCRDAGTALLVDEAFIDFTDLLTLAGHDGVVVARSLTKIFGLPGLRAGFAVATGEYRDRLDTARLSWGLGTVAAAVGTHCLGQTAFVEATRERVASERARMRDRLSERFDVHPSDAPFLLLDCGSAEAVEDLLETVERADIAVRDARTFRGLDQHVRVAVRLPDENDRLLDALDV
ncbi:threonine-phosphate decarboxylase CobD [Salinibaculum rarum]|uniref:threonine-phosphate decarboxylase CobD n=1 Tax=Salinibaculum rarum TaxID=3058903 RepID=UPI00265FB29E|nr:threonine-phosphate decarboxylase CobD [Salinibaculum sp. KK48]